MALRRRLSSFLVLATAAAAAAAACHESSPTAPESRPALVLSYTGPCARRFVPVTVDGTAVGAVAIPGNLAWPLGPGHHTVQVGASPEFTVEMPADRDLVVTNQPTPCP